MIKVFWYGHWYGTYVGIIYHDDKKMFTIKTDEPSYIDFFKYQGYSWEYED